MTTMEGSVKSNGSKPTEPLPDTSAAPSAMRKAAAKERLAAIAERAERSPSRSLPRLDAQTAAMVKEKVLAASSMDWKRQAAMMLTTLAGIGPTCDSRFDWDDVALEWRRRCEKELPELAEAAAAQTAANAVAQEGNAESLAMLVMRLCVLEWWLEGSYKWKAR